MAFFESPCGAGFGMGLLAILDRDGTADCSDEEGPNDTMDLIIEPRVPGSILLPGCNTKSGGGIGGGGAKPGAGLFLD